MTFIWTILQYLTSQIIRIWKYRIGGSNQNSTQALLLINQLTLHKILLIYKLILLRSLHSGRRDYELCRTLIKPSWTTYDSRYYSRRGEDDRINLCKQIWILTMTPFSAAFLHWRQHTDRFHVWDMCRYTNLGNANALHFHNGGGSCLLCGAAYMDKTYKWHKQRMNVKRDMDRYQSTSCKFQFHRIVHSRSVLNI